MYIYLIDTLKNISMKYPHVTLIHMLHKHITQICLKCQSFLYGENNQHRSVVLRYSAYYFFLWSPCYTTAHQNTMLLIVIRFTHRETSPLWVPHIAPPSLWSPTFYSLHIYSHIYHSPFLSRWETETSWLSYLLRKEYRNDSTCTQQNYILP